MAKKSDHKHLYEDCLIRQNINRFDQTQGFISCDTYVKGVHCTICGKTRIKEWFITIPVNNGYVKRLLTGEEILEVYKDLPIVDEKRD